MLVMNCMWNLDDILINLDVLEDHRFGHLNVLWKDMSSANLDVLGKGMVRPS